MFGQVMCCYCVLVDMLTPLLLCWWHPDTVCVLVMYRCGQHTGPPLRVCYQRHAYGLGEHYNSVVPGEAEDTEEEAEAEAEDGDEGESGGEEDNPYADEEVTGNKTKAAANQAKALASLRKKKGRDTGKGNSRAGVFI